MTEVAAAVLPPRIHLTSLLQPQEGKFHRRSAIQHAAGSKRPHFQGSCLLFVFSGTGTKLGFSVNRGTESRVCLHACVCACFDLASLVSNADWGSPHFLLPGAPSTAGCPFLWKSGELLRFGNASSLLYLVGSDH